MDFAVVLREAAPDDRPFLCSSYLQHFHRGHPIKFVPNSLYFARQTKILEHLLDNASVLVACFPEDPSQIVGYIISQHALHACVVHYIYVRGCYRGRKVGRQMLDAVAEDSELIIATHAGDEFSALKHKAKPRRVVYDPYLLPALRRMAG